MPSKAKTGTQNIPNHKCRFFSQQQFAHPAFTLESFTPGLNAIKLELFTSSLFIGKLEEKNYNSKCNLYRPLSSATLSNLLQGYTTNEHGAIKKKCLIVVDII